MKLKIALSAACALFAALPAQAVTYSVGTIDSGPTDVSSTFQPGYTSYTFDDYSSPFVGGAVRSGTASNLYVAPAGDTTPYFSVGPSTSSPATLGLSGVNQLSFYWGSIDPYNTITFNGLGQSFTGEMFGGTVALEGQEPSRQVTFYFSPSEASALTGISLSSTTNAFEIDNLVFGSAVPEPATWAMMILGLGMVGGTMRRRQKVTARVAYTA